MKKAKSLTLLAATLAMLSACTESAESGPAIDIGGAEPSDGGSVVLVEVSDRLWQNVLDRSPQVRLREGLPVERLADLTAEAASADAALARELLGRLDEVDAESLSHDDWLELRSLQWELAIMVDGEPWFWHESLLTPYSSPIAGLRQLFALLPVSGDEDRRRYLDLVGQVPAMIGQVEVRARGQAERGIVVPLQNLPAVIGIVRAQGVTPSEGPFAIAPERLGDLDEDDRSELLAGVEKVVEGEINPALERLAGYLDGDYRALATEEVGASRYPDGEEFYRYAVRRSVTLDVSPEEIHERGLRLIAEMEAAMAEIQEAVGFDGTREEFHQHLRSDPQYFPESPDEVAERLMGAAADMEEQVDRYFEKRPEAPYGVERLDPALEGSQTYGYYNPPTPERPKGLYFYNGSRLDQRSWIGLRAISLHELTPGHHFHIARQLENDALSDYRRNTMHTAFTEGWGSYATYLGQEAGIYDQDPLSRYGMYVLEIFLASRLVVDTGMNLMGWSLEEGRAYQLDHTLESETQIASESLRYSTDMPAQALGYQMGKLELLSLRTKAERELGDAFDLRAFHEALHQHGSLPLSVLQEHVDWWIAQHQGR